MKKMDEMEAGEGRKEIDYILASPFVSANDPNQRRVLGLNGQKKGQLESVGGYRPPNSAAKSKSEPQRHGVEMLVATDMDQELFSPTSSALGESPNNLRARSPRPSDIPEDQEWPPEAFDDADRNPKPLVKMNEFEASKRR